MLRYKSYLRPLALLWLGLTIGGCNYLDVVPDKSQDISQLFERRESAFKALATCYSYLPSESDVYKSSIFAADELITPLTKQTSGGEIMRGKQTAAAPLEGTWCTNTFVGATRVTLWEAIRACNTLIENIHLVPDMSPKEKATWTAETTVLKAFYHFLLFRQYGPIPIVDKNLPITASIEEIRIERQPVDDVVDYMVKSIDRVSDELTVRITSGNDMGRIDRVIALSIKARILLYAASPLFNGNAEFYENFKNKRGEKLFNTTYNKEKWKSAADAAKAAIDLASENQIKTYHFNGQVPEFDTKNYQKKEIEAYYNVRYSITDKWNSEVIWGHSNPPRNGDWWNLQSAIGMLIQDGTTQNEAAWAWAAPTLSSVESYYTKNGLPMEEDIEWITYYASGNDRGRYYVRPTNMKTLFEKDSANCLLQTPDRRPEQVLLMHLGREPRFYSSIAFDRGYNRSRGKLLPVYSRYNEQNGRKTSNDYSMTGYYCTKLIHPESDGSKYNLLVSYPWPLVRLSELYLNYAEALNEYQDAPTQNIYDALNEVRLRAGIPTIEESWAKAKTTDKHKTKKGLQEIIRQERRIELAFECHRNFDVRRWKEAEKWFSAPATGWRTDQTAPTSFYNVTTGFATPVVVGQRSFISPRDYLWPIKNSETVINPNLIQNPGW